MPDLAVEGLVHVYPESGVRALDGIDLRIRGGERVGIVGQNGSGKSTLVRHLNGLLRPTDGRVTIDGADAARLTVARLAPRVGLVFQDPDRQVFSSSVRTEVEFGPRNLGRRGEELRSAVNRALSATGLDGEERTNPYDLGQSRRKLLALASVLAMETDVLVLDEPTTGQDARGVERIRAIVDAVAAAGRTVIAISHDMRFVAETFDRVVVMRAGRIVLDGPPATVFAAEAWEALRSTYLDLVEAVGDATEPEAAKRRREALGEVAVAQQPEHQRRVSAVEELDRARRVHRVHLVQAELALERVEGAVRLLARRRGEMRGTVHEDARPVERLTDAAVPIEAGLDHGTHLTRSRGLATRRRRSARDRRTADPAG
jgi:energy-coupling factor transport system ATP-binding protein